MLNNMLILSRERFEYLIELNDWWMFIATLDYVFIQEDVNLYTCAKHLGPVENTLDLTYDDVCTIINTLAEKPNGR
jgi:hypothetical protein